MSYDRLTRDVRLAVVKKALDAKFDPIDVGIQVMKTELADALYRHNVGPRQEDAARSLGPEWISFDVDLQIDCEGFSYQGESRFIEENDHRWPQVCSQLKMSKEMPIPSKLGRKLSIKEDHPLWPMAQAIVQARNKMLEDRELLRQQMNTILWSVQTRKKLLEVWPECESLLPPAPQSGSTALVPIDTIKSVNAALGLPPEEIVEP